MPEWAVTRISADGTLGAPSAAGASPTHCKAWADAIEATMDCVGTGEHGRFWLDVDGHPGLLAPGRGDNGHVDLAETRAALERMAAAAMGISL